MVSLFFSLEKQMNNISCETIWGLAVSRLRSTREALYKQWFSKIEPISVEGTTVTFKVPDSFFGGIIKDQYGDILEEALKNIESKDYTFSFVSDNELEESKPKKSASRGKPVKRSSRISPKEEIVEKVKEDFEDDFEDTTNVIVLDNPSTNNSTLSEHRMSLSERPAELRPQIKKHDMTFENFIVSDSNRHTYAAAKAAAEEPGLYNPLYIYGSNGIGKTHLLRAIANETLRKNPKTVVRFTTCDDLLNEFYELLSSKQNLSTFRSQLRDVDLLLVDDVHRLAKKTQMQEEFFNLFNTLYDKHKQIVFTSDRQPCEISDIAKRPTTRFEAGVITEIGMLEYESRLAFLKMCRNEILTKTPLNDEFLEFLASSISSSVRRLKGAFLRLATYASLSGNNHLTIAQAETLLHTQLKQESSTKTIQIEEIQSCVANMFGITVAEILGSKRTSNIAEPRMIAMFLCRELTEKSTTEIGEAFGRNHATILHAENKVPQLLQSNNAMRLAVEEIRRNLQK
jgi:chromosomal replication initiator protein